MDHRRRDGEGTQTRGGVVVTFEEILTQAIAMLQRLGRVSYRALKVQFQLDDDLLELLKDEIVEVHQLARDQEGKMLVWTGDTTAAAPSLPPTPDQAHAPLTYTPPYLAEKILTSRSALEGERKQVTVLFADLKGSMELLADRDPEEARQLLDPVLERMMEAVHRYEGTVNQVMGDGIMALFGAPLAHEDHAVRACYAALAMQAAVKQYAAEVQRSHGVPVQIRVGLNAGEVVVRAIGSDLHMDYTAVGQTTHLAARMEQMAMPGSILLTQAVLSLAEGYVQVTPLGPMPVKGSTAPVDVFELVGASGIRRRLQATAARGLTRFVGRDTEFAALVQALERAGAGHGQVVAVVGEAGVGKSRLVYECLHSHHTQGWRVLESASVSYGKATPYFPVLDLLRRYAHVDERDDPRTIRAKVTGQLLTLDEALQDAIPPLLALLDALPDDSPFLTLDPPQRRQRTLAALKRVLLRESQVQPVLVVFEDLHWIDTETQALLDSLVESLPTARLLLLVNYRPEYQHGWGSKTYYAQLRLDPLPPASADAFLQALLGDDPSLEALKPLLIARTAGNPFFLEESVRTLVETGVLVGERGAYRLAQALASLQVPATVQAVLAARIDRLPPEEKHLLQTAAVIGTEVPLPLLQAIAERARGEALHRGLAHLQAAEFLYETRLFPERDYTFKHALTHEVAYGSLLQERRRALHARIVEALERARPPSGWPSRSNAWRTMPCGARCGTRPWPTAGRRGTRPWRARPTARRWLLRAGAGGPAASAREPRQAGAGHRSPPRPAQCAACRSGNMRRMFDHVCAGRDPRRGVGRPASAGHGLALSDAIISRSWVTMTAPWRAGQRALALATASGAVDLQVMTPDPTWAWRTTPWGTIGRRCDCFEAGRGVPRREVGSTRASANSSCPAVHIPCHLWPGAWPSWGRSPRAGAMGEEAVRIAEAVAHPCSYRLALSGLVSSSLRQGDLHHAHPRARTGLGALSGRGHLAATSP